MAVACLARPRRNRGAATGGASFRSAPFRHSVSTVASPLLLLALATTSARAQLGGSNTGDCPVDISRVRLDDGLGKTCSDPNAPGRASDTS
jgi:hypothetical protein